MLVLKNTLWNTDEKSYFRDKLVCTVLVGNLLTGVFDNIQHD